MSQDNIPWLELCEKTRNNDTTVTTLEEFPKQYRTAKLVVDALQENTVLREIRLTLKKSEGDQVGSVGTFSLLSRLLHTSTSLEEIRVSEDRPGTTVVSRHEDAWECVLFPAIEQSSSLKELSLRNVELEKSNFMESYLSRAKTLEKLILHDCQLSDKNSAQAISRGLWNNASLKEFRLRKMSDDFP